MHLPYRVVWELAGGVYLEQRNSALRVGITAILFAIVCRLWAMGLPEKLLSFLIQPNTTAFLLYLETGRDVRFSSSQATFSPDFMESPPPVLPQPPEEPVPAFSEDDQVALYYAVKKDPDIGALLAKPLEWELRSEEPTVLILHTHATESYTKSGEDYKESAAWRTVDASYNMLAIGQQVQEILAEKGITAIQDRQLHDYPSCPDIYIIRLLIDCFKRKYAVF